MSKVTIIVDSTAYLMKEHVQDYGIEVVPINIHFRSAVYRDGVDIDKDKAYKLIEQAPELFANSPASSEVYAELFRRAAIKGHGWGPLEEKPRRLIKLGLATVLLSEGGVRSHAWRALEQGITPDELRYTVLPAFTTARFPQ
jgi:alkylhydroperoxidase/carboxymuconolactone decarboxylase family protein YurZ